MLNSPSKAAKVYMDFDDISTEPYNKINRFVNDQSYLAWSNVFGYMGEKILEPMRMFNRFEMTNWFKACQYATGDFDDDQSL